jgi:hypothetical protein
LSFPFSVQFLLASATTREPDQVIKIALIAAILAHQHDPKAVWVNNGDAEPGPRLEEDRRGGPASCSIPSSPGSAG